MPAVIHTDLGPRLESAQAAVKSAEVLLANERELRRRLVLQAVDEGMSQREVARKLKIGTGGLSKILATPDPEDDDQ
jgi:DNA-binding NarL/FixJ family response regulator